MKKYRDGIVNYKVLSQSEIKFDPAFYLANERYITGVKSAIIDLKYGQVKETNEIETYKSFLEDFSNDIPDSMKNEIESRLTNLGYDIKEVETEEKYKQIIDSTSIEIPPPSLPLFLASENLLKHPKSISENISQKIFLRGQTSSFEWNYKIEDELLNENCIYDLHLASDGITNIVIQIFLKHKKKKKLIEHTTFKVSSKTLMPYLGQFTCKGASAQNGDEIILRITASGRDFTIQQGLGYSSINLIKLSNLPRVLLKERNDALQWFVNNIKESIDPSRFLEFAVKLDVLIVIDRSGEWGIGWENINSGKPYLLKWEDKSFSSKVMTRDEANLIGVDDESFVFKIGYLLRNYKVGNNPCAMISNDFNNDGYNDLAVTNDESDNVSVLLNNGDGSFSTATNYLVGDSPPSLCSSDFNGDGYNDLAITNSKSNNMSILINNNDGTFQPTKNYNTGETPYSICASDFDNDGDYDLVTANFGNDNISVFFNNGDGTFDISTNYNVGKDPRSVYSADLDNDGDADLAVANMGSNNISILFNDNNGTFQPAVNYSTDKLPYAVFSKDLDNDSDYDIVSVNFGSANIVVLLNKGDGTFKISETWVGGIATSVFPADLDNDGQNELVVSRPKKNIVLILKNTGEGTFLLSLPGWKSGGGSPVAVIATDLNGDGYSDLAVANMISNNVSILFNNGDGTF